MPVKSFLFTVSLLAGLAWAGTQTIYTFNGRALMGPRNELLGPDAALPPCMDPDAGWFEAWCLGGDGGIEVSINGRPMGLAGTPGTSGIAAFNAKRSARTFSGTSVFDSRTFDDAGAPNVNLGDGGVFIAAWLYYETDAGSLGAGNSSRESYVGTSTQDALSHMRSTSASCGVTDDVSALWTPATANTNCQPSNSGAISSGAWHHVAMWRHYTPGAGPDMWEAKFWVDGAATQTLPSVQRATGTPDVASGSIFLVGRWSGTVPWSVRISQYGIRRYLPTDAQVAADYNYSRPSP